MCAGVLVCTLLALQVSVVGGALCNATCAAQSAVYAEGLSLATAGEAVRFLILARDSRGAPTGRGGEAWDIRATHALGPSLPVALEVHANGTYSAAATATVAGRYVLRVRLRPLLVDVGGTPLRFTVAPAAIDPASCAAPGLDGRAAEAGAPLTFALEARDRFGNARRDAPALFSAEARYVPPSALPGPTNKTAVVSVAPQGHAAGALNLTVAGSYTVRLRYNGTACAGALATVRVVAAAPAPRSAQLLSPPASGNLSASAHAFARLTVRLADAFGNMRVGGGDDVRAALAAGPRAGAHPLLVTHHGGGIYEVLCRLTRAGSYVLALALSAEPLPFSPVAVRVAAGAGVASMGRLDGAGAAAGIAGVNATFAIMLRDAFGNAAADAPRAPLSVRLLLPPGAGAPPADVSAATGASVSVLRADGSRGGAYRCTRAGAYLLDVRLAGAPLLGGPFPLEVAPAPPSAADSTAVQVPPCPRPGARPPAAGRRAPAERAPPPSLPY